MTTKIKIKAILQPQVVEAYRLDRYDNFKGRFFVLIWVVEAYRLDRYDNFLLR